MMMVFISLAILLLGSPFVVLACTDILVTPGASVDGSAMIAYNADSPTLFGSLYHYPSSTATATGKTDDQEVMRQIYNWDTGKYLGEIPEAPITYNVVGNVNEFGLCIGETTFGGIAPLSVPQEKGILDYGSLIYITLQRAKTAREAISVMTTLLDTYGYASSGESFSIADATTGEVWMMELIGRGDTYGTLGAVWVAQQVPPGSIAAHANQARTTTFAHNDPDNCLYADDIVDVAVHYGLYPADADPIDFDFSQAFDPPDFVKVRTGDARVWSIFSELVDDTNFFRDAHADYILGNVTDYSAPNRMPLWIIPYKQVSFMDISNAMNSHYEGTYLDSTADVGAGLFESPYRPRPLVWQYQNKTYHNERNIATAKTGWNFIAQIRPWMPLELSAIIWFAVDDSSTSPRVPVYGSSREIAKPYAGKGSQDGVTTPILHFNIDQAFWVQNMVSNFCYAQWDKVYPLVRRRIDESTKDFINQVALVDARALKVYKSGNVTAAVDYVTQFSVLAGNRLHESWWKFYGELFVQFRDYYVITPKPDDPVCNCQADEPGMSEATKKRIVKETGGHYKVVDSKNNNPDVLYHGPAAAALTA